MALLSKKKKKRWIWTAVNRATGEIIDFEIGCRGTKTFRRLWRRLCSIRCTTFFSDNWHAYRELIPRQKHVVSKGETCLVESKNSQIRNYGSPFRRKTKCVSKTQIMIYNQMLLVVNKINAIAREDMNKRMLIN